MGDLIASSSSSTLSIMSIMRCLISFIIVFSACAAQEQFSNPVEELLRVSNSAYAPMDGDFLGLSVAQTDVAATGGDPYGLAKAEQNLHSIGGLARKAVDELKTTADNKQRALNKLPRGERCVKEGDEAIKRATEHVTKSTKENDAAQNARVEFGSRTFSSVMNLETSKNCDGFYT